MNYNFEHITQSSWLGDLYNKYLPDSGFFVEIGMGHTTTPESRQSNFTKLELHGSNTIELLSLNWNGIFIEPVTEFCYEAILLLKDKLDKIKIINTGASDIYEICTMYGEETMIPNDIVPYKDYATGENYNYPGKKVLCKPTSVILSEVNCPKQIDLMSIDVEGYEDKTLKGIDFNLHYPTMLIIESTRINNDMIKDIIPETYELIQHDNLNSCWVCDKTKTQEN